MVERGEERFQMLTITEDTKYQASAGLDDLTWYLDEAHQEPLEFHSQDVPTCHGCQGHQAIPGFQIPCQRRDDHVSPVGLQTVRWHSQRIDPAFKLTNDVFLVAAVVGEKDHFLHAHGAIVGDIEENAYYFDSGSMSS